MHDGLAHNIVLFTLAIIISAIAQAQYEYKKDTFQKDIVIRICRLIMLVGTIAVIGTMLVLLIRIH